MRSEDRRTILAACAALAAGGLILLATLIAGLATGTPFAMFSRDPSLTLGGHPFVGVQSNLGVLAMWASGAVLLFTWIVTRGRLRARDGSFLLASGLLSLFLAFDDLFMFHDYVWPAVSGGKDEWWVYTAYLGLALIWAAWYRRIVFDRENRLMLVAGGFLALSLFVDQAYAPIEGIVGPEWRIFMEDGAKLLSYACWTAAVVLHSARVLERWRVQADGPVEPGT